MAAVDLLLKAFDGVTVAPETSQNTRVALVSYASEAIAIGNLTKYATLAEFEGDLKNVKLSMDDGANLSSALTTFDFINTRVDTIAYTDRPTLFLVVASSEADPDDVKFRLDLLKQMGAKVMTIAVLPNGTSQDPIGTFASTGMSFRLSRDSKSVDTAFVTSNCFCPVNWVRVSDNFDHPTKLFGECVNLSATAKGWSIASISCGGVAGSIQVKALLVSEFSKMKHDFNVAYVRSLSGAFAPYHIGLRYYGDYDEAEYKWQQKDDNGNIPLTSDSYQPWRVARKYNLPVGAVAVQQDGEDTYWANILDYGVQYRYICQSIACDTENYCPPDVYS